LVWDDGEDVEPGDEFEVYCWDKAVDLEELGMSQEMYDKLYDMNT